LTFVLARVVIKPVVAPTDTGVKDSRRGGVYVDEHVIDVECASVRDPPIQIETTDTHEANVLDVVLVSGCTRTIDGDCVCGLLTECLQDVSSIAFTLHPLVVYYLASNFRLFLQ
jgi:hypothetical protein